MYVVLNFYTKPKTVCTVICTQHATEPLPGLYSIWQNNDFFFSWTCSDLKHNYIWGKSNSILKEQSWVCRSVWLISMHLSIRKAVKPCFCTSFQTGLWYPAQKATSTGDQSLRKGKSIKVKKCAELQTKGSFRDKTFRNSLKIP